MNTKACTKCKQEKPATLEFFWREKSGKFGVRGDCKICASQRESRKDYFNNLYHDDAEYRLYKNLQVSLSNTLKGNGKNCKTVEYLGCSISELRGYIEEQFKVGMSWDNYGEWHIDHILPRVSFDHTKESEIFKCWHYSNLQPLWAYENFSKGATLPI